LKTSTELIEQSKTHEDILFHQMINTLNQSPHDWHVH